MNRIVAIVLLTAYFCFPSSGQQISERLSESDINQDKVIIEAKKQALIGNFENAKQLFQEILKKDSHNDVAAYELARIYHMEKDYGNALEQIDKALGITPDEKWYLQLKADILEDDEEFARAAGVYEDLRKKDPRNDAHLRHLAFLYSMTGKYESAVQILDIIETQHGITENTSLQKHELYRELGKKNEALNVLIKLCEKYPDHLDYLHLLANYYRQLNKDDLARETYETILKLDSNDARANVALSEKFKAEGNYIQYLRSLEPIISNDQASIDVKIAEILPYLKMYKENRDEGLLSELMNVAEILENAHPAEAKVYAFYGDLYSFSDRSAEAVEKYKKTLELDESNYYVWEQLLLHQAQLQQTDDLLTYCESAMDLFPNKALLYYLHGLGNTNLGNLSMARESLEQALLMGRSDQDFKFNTLYLLGKVYQRLGLEEQSFQSYESALELNPEHPEFLNDFSYSLALHGDRLDYALELVNKALKFRPQHPKFLATQAWIYYRKQNFHKAREIMESSLNHGGMETGYILDKYGDILFQLGESDRALEMWKLAKVKGYNSQVLERKISERKWFEEQ